MFKYMVYIAIYKILDTLITSILINYGFGISLDVIFGLGEPWVVERLLGGWSTEWVDL